MSAGFFTLQKRLLKSALPAMIVGLWLCSAAGRAQAPPITEGVAARFEPRALQLLHSMVEAYAHLDALQQETDFFSTITPLLPGGGLPIPPVSDSPDRAQPDRPPMDPAPNPVPDSASSKPPSSETERPRQAVKEQKSGRRLRLLYARPNRLLLEMQEPDAQTSAVKTSQWLSDGRQFWTFNPNKNWYTKEKAPGNLRDLARRPNMNTGTLELLMLMGIDPFAGLKDQVDSIRCEGTETVGDTETEVVSLRVSTPSQETEARLYIGKGDLLLRRLVVETTPVTAGVPRGYVGDALDALDGPTQPSPSRAEGAGPEDAQSSGQAAHVKVRIRYDNRVTAHPTFGALDFAFTVPAGAFLYAPPDQRQQTPARKNHFSAYLKSLGFDKPRKSPWPRR